MRTQMYYLDKEIDEFKSQLSYSRRIGLLIGAGASKALGISDIAQLSTKVEDLLDANDKASYTKIKDCVDTDKPTVEDILNHARLIRQITGESPTKSYEGVTGEAAKNLDIEICAKIYEIISTEEEGINIAPTNKLIGWLNWLSRDYTKEIFTTNYDLVLERSLESQQIPYYDGFVGASEPFFLPDSLDDRNLLDLPPKAWIRLWKLHGSIGWFWREGEKGSHHIVRTNRDHENLSGKELVIYPSREKYELSRKQPFIAYFDRMAAFLRHGEGLFIISGYSFSDAHINAVIFDALKQNNRLHVIGFLYLDETVEKINDLGHTLINFTVFGPKKAIIRGTLGDWHVPPEDKEPPYWDKDLSTFRLGDFTALVDFLLQSSGQQSKILDEELSVDHEK